MSKVDAQEKIVVAFSEFLESIPPSVPAFVSGALHPNGNLLFPELALHCSNEKCNGIRFYRCGDPSAWVGVEYPVRTYINYFCANCRVNRKIFSISIIRTSVNEAKCVKFGEDPVYGPPVPPRLLKLIGPDRDLFLKGRRCENQGLGVGAFVYYRRVVENQKNRIVDEIIKVSEKIGVSKANLDVLKSSQSDFRFSSAVDIIKDLIPQSLLINGHNPLTLLHKALSDGLHDRSDEHCLELAGSIRVVLGELAERLSQALKDEAEVNHALARLMSIKK